MLCEIVCRSSFENAGVRASRTGFHRGGQIRVMVWRLRTPAFGLFLGFCCRASKPPDPVGTVSALVSRRVPKLSSGHCTAVHRTITSYPQPMTTKLTTGNFISVAGSTARWSARLDEHDPWAHAYLAPSPASDVLAGMNLRLLSKGRLGLPPMLYSNRAGYPGISADRRL